MIYTHHAIATSSSKNEITKREEKQRLPPLNVVSVVVGEGWYIELVLIFVSDELAKLLLNDGMMEAILVVALFNGVCFCLGSIVNWNISPSGISMSNPANAFSKKLLTGVPAINYITIELCFMTDL